MIKNYRNFFRCHYYRQLPFSAEGGLIEEFNCPIGRVNILGTELFDVDCVDNYNVFNSVAEKIEGKNGYFYAQYSEYKLDIRSLTVSLQVKQSGNFSGDINEDLG